MPKNHKKVCENTNEEKYKNVLFLMLDWTLRRCEFYWYSFDKVSFWDLESLFVTLSWLIEDFKVVPFCTKSLTVRLWHSEKFLLRGFFFLSFHKDFLQSHPICHHSSSRLPLLLLNRMNFQGTLLVCLTFHRFSHPLFEVVFTSKLL